jgi:hypothetical protein
MPGGKFHSPIWTPYALYGTVDYMYGWPAWNAGIGFTAAQGSLKCDRVRDGHLLPLGGVCKREGEERREEGFHVVYVGGEEGGGRRTGSARCLGGGGDDTEQDSVVL